VVARPLGCDRVPGLVMAQSVSGPLTPVVLGLRSSAVSWSQCSGVWMLQYCPAASRQQLPALKQMQCSAESRIPVTGGCADGRHCPTQHSVLHHHHHAHCHPYCHCQQKEQAH